NDEQRGGGREGQEEGQTRSPHAAPGVGEQRKGDSPRRENRSHQAEEGGHPEQAERPARAEETKAMDGSGERRAEYRHDPQGERGHGETRRASRPLSPLVSASRRHGPGPPPRGAEHTAA